MQPQNWEKMFRKHTSDKQFAFRTYKDLWQLYSMRTNSSIKRSKDLNTTNKDQKINHSARKDAHITYHQRNAN